MKRLLITICGRAGSKGFKNKNLKNFCGKPLVYYSLSAAELFIKKHPELEIDVALNTDSEDLARLVAAEYPEVIYLPRGAELGGDRVPKVEVYKDSFARMEARTGKQYDAMIDLDITSPLRTEQDIENAFAKAQEREDLQIIFSVCEARRNPWFNMFKIVGDHAEMVIESQFTGRQQAPEVYDVNASIYVIRRAFLVDNPDRCSLWCWAGASLRPTSPAHRWVCCCKSCLCPRAAFRPCTTCAITVCCWCWAVSARPRCRTGCGRKSAKILWQSSLCLPC